MSNEATVNLMVGFKLEDQDESSFDKAPLLHNEPLLKEKEVEEVYDAYGNIIFVGITVAEWSQRRQMHLVDESKLEAARKTMQELVDQSGIEIKTCLTLKFDI